MQTKADPNTMSKYLSIDGHQLHYLDRGQGPILLFVHGIPEWSGTYEQVILALGTTYRCIVPDHLGFGLSDTDNGADLRPTAHSKRLLALIQALDLTGIHLVVHDYGGPIGIGALVQEPTRFKSLTLSNTWLWSTQGAGAKVLKLMSGWLGRWLYLSYGFSVKYMARRGFAEQRTYLENKALLMQHHHTKKQRYANYVLMLEMHKSGSYFDDLLLQLRGINLPGCFIWGSKDVFFNTHEYLARWKKELPLYPVLEIESAGHFPHMESASTFAKHVRDFLIETSGKMQV